MFSPVPYALITEKQGSADESVTNLKQYGMYGTSTFLYNPGPRLTVDERLIAFRGRSSFKKYI